MEQGIVTSELTAMANADATANIAKQPTIEQQLAAQQLIVDAAFEANDYSKLAIASQLMLKLQAQAERAISAKLEAKLKDELAEVLDVYQMELAPYNELRLHISDGTIKAVTLMNALASVTKAVKATSSATGVTKAGLPSSAKLLETHGSCLYEDGFAMGVPFSTLFANAKDAKDAKNAVYQARVKLLKHCETHKQ
jgi:hypothetical protein